MDNRNSFNSCFEFFKSFKRGLNSLNFSFNFLSSCGFSEDSLSSFAEFSSLVSNVSASSEGYCLLKIAIFNMLALNSISKLDFSFLENNSIFKPLYKMIEIKIIIKAINIIKNSTKFIYWPLIIISFIWNDLVLLFKSLVFS